MGAPDNVSEFNSKFYFSVDGQEVVFNSPLENKTNNPTKGDDYKTFSVGNPIYINPRNNMELFVNSNKKEVEVEVISGKDDVSADISIKIPDGIKYTPESQRVIFSKKGEKKILKFEIDLSGGRESEYEIIFEAMHANSSYSRAVSYTHLTLPTICSV